MSGALTPAEAERAARQALAAGDAVRAEALARAILGAGGNAGTAAVWALLAQALRRQLRPEEARDIQTMLVDAFPGNLDLRFDLAETLLQLGDFERGWREYAYRYRLVHTAGLERKVQAPRWDGRPMPGQTLLIHDEQGFGDTFQFIRLLARAKERSQAHLVLQIAPAQAGFARRMAGIDAVILRGALPPPFARHCEMMSLPMALGLRLKDLPGPMPYLSADPARLRHWARRLADLPRPLVALVWAGRPNHVNDANRSTHLARFAPLAAVGGCSFLSIQKGPRADEAATPPAGMNLTDLGPEITDFDDTAAILSHADLLISVDSSPVHLAGGLGRPAWVILPYLAEWRWLLGRDDSPWYPSLRLFRQDHPGDWAGVMTRLAAALVEVRAGKSSFS